MSKFTFLTTNHIYGDIHGNNQLEIFKKYGTNCATTDFSILLGGHVSDLDFVHECTTEKNRASCWFLRTPYTDNKQINIVNCLNEVIEYSPNSRYIGARPALTYSSISSVPAYKLTNIDGIKEILYGEYPQTIASEDISIKLEKAYNNGNLKKTRKKYTTDSVHCYDEETNFRPRKHIEYEYNGNKFIRFVADSSSIGKTLSNGRIIEAGKAYWVKVEPITWLVDEKEDIALSKKILFSGVQFADYKKYTGDFENTNIKQFMDKFFSKDIIPSKSHLNSKKRYTPNLKETQKKDKKAKPTTYYLKNKEELETNKFFPLIYAYIAYKSFSREKNKQLKALGLLVDEDTTNDLIEFANKKAISVDDVINRNYLSKDLEMDLSEKFALAVVLSTVDDEHFKVVRNFIKEVAPESVTTFEYIWTKGNKDRLVYLEKLKSGENSRQVKIKGKFRLFKRMP